MKGRCSNSPQSTLRPVYDHVNHQRHLDRRDTGKRTGVPRSHISKIESGGTDIRLSSLIELARALDLDLRLLPRKAVSAVDNIVHRTVAATPAIRELNRTLDTVRNLCIVYPDLNELKRLQDSFQAFKNLPNIGNQLKALRDKGKTIRELQQTHKKFAEAGQLKAIHDVANIPAEQLQALREAASAAQNLRNQLVHAIPEQPSLPRPAYRLDDDGENEDG